MDLAYPKQLKLAHLPTPIQKLDTLSAEYNTNIWVKRDDLTGSVSSGNKIRKLEFSLARAKEQGADVLVTCGGIQSNHCRATAVLGAQLGFKVHLVLRGERPDQVEGNLFLDHLAGAEISYFSPRYFNARLDFIVQEISDEYRTEGKTPYFITTGASDATGVWGYINAAQEIAEQEKQLGVDFDTIVCATGSGGTQAGLTAGSILCGLETQVLGIAVCDDEEYFMKKVRRDILEWKQLYRLDFDLRHLKINVNDKYIGPGYAKATPDVFSTIERAMRKEGLALDPVYTGKAFHGLLSEIREGNLETENVLFIHTGGIFGLLAQREEYFAQL